MSRMHIELPYGRSAFEPGDEVELLLSWELDESPESVELRLCWNTAGKGTTDLAVVEKVPFEFPNAVETRRTTMALPSAPYSFSGQLISLIWAFELIAFPSESSTRQEITIAPAGQEVRLSKVPATEDSW